MGCNNSKDEIKANNFEKDKNFTDFKLNIFICGKYNKLMEVLIGEKKEILQNDKLESNNICKIYINKDNLSTKDMDIKENKINNISENLLDKNDENQKINNEKDINKQININKFLNDLKDHEKQILSNNNFFIKNSSFNNWNLHFFCKNEFDIKSLEEIKSIIYDNIDIDNKNILIIFIESNIQIYNTIDIFNKINKEYQPLFLFIMSQSYINKKNNKNIGIDKILDDINKYIRDKCIYKFNIRNIKIIKEIILIDNFNIETNNEEFDKKKYKYILDIYLFLINSMYYYNNLGDDFEFEKYLNGNSTQFLDEINQEKVKLNKLDNKLAFFNILILGRPGVGKSTLVNILSDSKRSMEARGVLVTKNIIKYAIKEYNICLYDSPGFEYEQDILKIQKLIEDLNKYLIKSKNQIHLVFYLISSSGARDFYDKEINILKTIKSFDIPIFFLLTFSQTLQRGNEKKELVERDLKRIYKEIDPINGYKYFKEKTYIFPVNLLDEYEFSIKNFGLKTVLKEVYTRFKNCIICEEDIEEIKQNLKKTEKKDKKIVFLKKQEILYTLNKNGNNLYKYIKEINDVMINAKIYSESTINNYSIASGILGLFGIFTSFLLKNFRKNILLTLADNFKKTDKEKENLINENSQIINGNTIFNNIPLISIRTNYNNIKEFGIHYLNLFSEELEREGIEGMGKLLLKLINCYNNSINSLLKLSEKFEE